MDTKEKYRIPEILQPHQEAAIPIDERVLTEVDHLIEHRREDGSYGQEVLGDMLTNLRTAVKEAAMPYAVATPEHDVVTDPESKKRVFKWLGQTAVESAQSGYRYHNHSSARARVDMEVKEAKHAQETLQPGKVQFFISPKMSRADASLEVAKEEHLADDDSLRCRWLETDDHGNVTKHKMQSILVSDVPLQAWVSYLADSQNIFGKSIIVEDPKSALSVMKTFEQLELDADEAPHGVLSLVEGVIPHIDDITAKTKVEQHLVLFNGDQAFMRNEAEKIAQQWLSFEGHLADSIVEGEANDVVERFIENLCGHWNEDSQKVIENHKVDGGYAMSRPLAKILEKAKQNTLWTTGAVLTNNEKVISQMETEKVETIRINQLWADRNPVEAHHIERENARAIASQNVDVGGGCNGANKDNFKDLTSEEADQLSNSDSDSENESTMKCVNCPSCDRFHEEVKKENGKLVCDNPSCKLAGSHAKKKRQD